MSTRTTNLGPRVSFTTTLADAGPVHVYGDSNSTFQWDGNFLLGASGSAINGIFVSSISVDFDTVSGNDSQTTSATINTMPADAIVLAVQPESAWSGAYYDIGLSAKPSAASTLLLSARNSAETDIDPDALTFDIVWIDPV